jgi:hypothetical protein
MVQSKLCGCGPDELRLAFKRNVKANAPLCEVEVEKINPPPQIHLRHHCSHCRRLPQLSQISEAFKTWDCYLLGTGS